MGKVAAAVVLAVFVLCVFSAAYAESPLTDEEKLAKGWIVSHVSYDASDTIAILDVKALINGSPAQVWSVLSDIGRWSSWVPVMSRGAVVNQAVLDQIESEPLKSDETYRKVYTAPPGHAQIDSEGRSEVTTFEEFDFPWPINNDWVLRRYLFDSAEAKSGKYKVSWKQLFKGTEGRGGKWTISKAGSENETLFEYHFRVKRKEGVPRAVFEIIIGKTVDRFINAIRRNVES